MRVEHSIGSVRKLTMCTFGLRRLQIHSSDSVVSHSPYRLQWGLQFPSDLPIGPEGSGFDDSARPWVRPETP